jgi:preprotein translocase subunit SecF
MVGFIHPVTIDETLAEIKGNAAMYNLMQKRLLWFIISLIAIAPGVLFMIWSTISTGSPLPLSIDYTGGTLWEIRFQEPVAPTTVRQVFVDAGYSDTTAFTVEDEQTVQVKLKNIDIAEKDALEVQLQEQIGPFEERSFRSIGPTIGAEVAQAAVVAVLIASALILLYIAAVFRTVPHPFRYGTCAVAALVHDVLIMISFVSIMNLIAGWEVDALFLTAALTVIGFSVNDTIVVFDRVRENLRRYRTAPFVTVANRSVIETALRSVATQVTALFVLVAILILGGATLRQFMAVLIVGLVSGTYSSIFNATALLVAWEERSFLPKGSGRSTPSAGQAAPA